MTAPSASPEKSRRPRPNGRPQRRRGSLLARLVLPLAAAVLAIGVAACGAQSETAATKVDFSTMSPPAKEGLNEVKWAVNGEPSTLDPIYAYNFWDDQINANMCESLFRLNPDLTTSPLLANEARNPDPTTWVYDIRKGVKFWDGKELTAEDVAYSMNRNLDPDLGSFFAIYYSLVKDIRATGPYEVTVRLQKPDALWNQVLVVGGSAIVEKAWAEKQGKKLGTADGGLMCSGPYKLANWARGSGITLERNPDYWDPEGRALSDRIVFRFLEDRAAQTQALVGGDVDGMYLIDPSGLPRLRNSAGKLYFGRNFMLNFLIPTGRSSPMHDAKVRKALSLLVDRPAIVKNVYDGAAQPMRTMVTPTIWGSNDAVRKIYQPEWDASAIYAKPDVAKAKQLFEEAGSPKQPITLAFPTGGAEQQISEAVQSAAQSIGMNIRLKGYSLTGIANLYYDPKAQEKAGIDLLYSPFNVDTADPFGIYQLFIPDVHSIYNYSGYENPEVTRLLTRARETYDDVQRAKYTAGAEKILMDDLPMIPLVAPYVMSYFNNRVTGAPTSYSVYWSAWANRLGASNAGDS